MVGSMVTCKGHTAWQGMISTVAATETLTATHLPLRNELGATVIKLKGLNGFAIRHVNERGIRGRRRHGLLHGL